MLFRSKIIFDGNVLIGVPLNWKSNISKLEGIGFKPRISLNEGIKQLSPIAISELNKA